MSAVERNPNDCIYCGGWTCAHCKPPHDPGEQGLTADEKQTIALNNRVRELEGKLSDSADALVTARAMLQRIRLKSTDDDARAWAEEGLGLSLDPDEVTR